MSLSVMLGILWIVAKEQDFFGETMKYILILTADYGYGHRSAASAIAEALQETYGADCSAEIVNPMDDPKRPCYFA